MFFVIKEANSGGFQGFYGNETKRALVSLLKYTSVRRDGIKLARLYQYTSQIKPKQH